MVEVSDLPERAEIRGVTVRLDRLPSGPAWTWREEGRNGLVLHERIQWLPETRGWLRHTAVSEPGGLDGGWQSYPALYQRAYDESEAWTVVQRVLEKEFGNGRPDLP